MGGKYYKDPDCKFSVFSTFVKKTIVKPISNNRYMDLLSRDKYYGYGCSYDIGSIYVKGPLIPFNSVVSVNGQNMSRRKVLRKFNEYNNK